MIEPNDRTARQMARLSGIAYIRGHLALDLALELYCEEFHSGAEFQCRAFDIQATHTQAFVFWCDEMAVVSIRGTEPEQLRDLLTDIRLTQEAGPFSSDHSKVHRGFWAAASSLLNEPEFLPTCWEATRIEKPLFVTGHSLGGAVATLVSASLAQETHQGLQLYTFGSPRVGNHGFAALAAYATPAHFRYVHADDIVTRLPWLIGLYRHTGILCFIDNGMRLSVRPSMWAYYVKRYKTALSGLISFACRAFRDHSILLYIAATAAQQEEKENEHR